MPTSPTVEQGVDYVGEYLAIRLRAGDSFKLTSAITLDTGITISSADVIVYDSDGVAQTGITETANVTGSSVEWGLLDEAETATLVAGDDYTYVFRINLSNGTRRSIHYGPLFIESISGGKIQ